MSKAIIKVTAAQSGAQDFQRDRLLGAYRLYLDGVVIGIGPGRGEVSVCAGLVTPTPLCPLPLPPIVTHSGRTPYDVIDVTDKLRKLHTGAVAANALHAPLLMAVQAYHHEGNQSARVWCQLEISGSDGDSVTTEFGTGRSWKAFSADGVFNPSNQTTGMYGAPQ